MHASGSCVKVVAIKSSAAYCSGMSRPQKQPLRALTEQEQAELTGLARAWGEPAAHVARARALLAVSVGASVTAAAPRGPLGVSRAMGWPSWWAASMRWGW